MVARKSNSVLRAATLLHLLAEDPTSAWSLAEIARRADLSYASAHSLAGALEESGLLRRHPRTRAYTLGPALIALGAAARRGYRVVDDALPEMECLSRDLGLGCLASARVGDDMVMLAVTGPPSRSARASRSVSASRSHRRSAWRSSRGPTRRRSRTTSTCPVAGSRPRNVASTSRHSRSCANAGTAWCSTARRATDSWSASAHRPISTTSLLELALDDYALLHRDETTEYAVTALTAPVFAPDGDVILVLTVVGFASPLRADALPRYAARMFEATSAIQAAMTAAPPHERMHAP